MLFSIGRARPPAKPFIDEGMIFLRSSTMFGSAGTKKRDLSDAFFANHTIPRIQIHLDEDALAALRDKFRNRTT